jgi:hypothetical protein
MRMRNRNYISGLVAVSIILLFPFSCYRKDPPSFPSESIIRGQTIENINGNKTTLSRVTVLYEAVSKKSGRKGKFSLTVIPVPGKNKVTFEKEGYETKVVSLPVEWAGKTTNLGQVALAKTTPEFDFATTELRGWSDPVSGTYFYTEKYRAYLADCGVNGSNCCVVNADRSYGFQWHSGNCPDGPSGKGWWHHIVTDGWQYQFGDEFESCFENYEDSREVNPAWLDLIDSRIQIAEDLGQWAILNLWCPYDVKWYGIPWFYWTPDCNLSPFTDSNHFYTDWQLTAMDALLRKVKHHPNLIISDNWESTGKANSVNLRWKKIVFNKVQSIIPGVPYFVYLDDYHADYAETVAWINSTPEISGLHSHYILGKDRSDFGLAANKRLLDTEEMDLSLNSTYRGLIWADQVNAGVCMYAGPYRNYKNTDGSEDTGKEERDYWYVKIRDYFRER